MLHTTPQAMDAALGHLVRRGNGSMSILHEGRFRSEALDLLARHAVFASGKVREHARWLLRAAAPRLGVYPMSIQHLYEARGRGECGGFTVPAINIRGLTYDVARAICRAALKHAAGAVIFEIARSEVDYTAQRPAEYASVVLAAAMREGFEGPLFIQGDHFQINAKKFAADPDKETKAVRALVSEAIAAGFYNIDIDTSTLVDLSKPTIEEQQRVNFTLAAELTKLVRAEQPAGVTISVGGEIGEVGGKNSTEEELRAYMQGYLGELGRASVGKGISKISIQTGTTHGGVPLPDGSIAKVKLDLDTLRRLSVVARSEFGMAGAVQHGASTLPAEAFHHFPETETAEVHLATEFQNLIYEHPAFPDELKQEIYEHLRGAHADERKATDTEEQFIYKTRKKGFGPFKQKLWDLPDDLRGAISDTLEKKFQFLFEQLKVMNTTELVGKYISKVETALPPAVTA
ncbi:MAG: class II fructose-bisphosphate aldolase [Candidatus Tectomicrobia bacterium]|nr:class II fructose-bisphosphate aldolase [Candidatus Tectomicrobia bacterium]